MPDPLWVMIARKYIGEKEIKGTKHNPLIVKMWQRIRLAGIRDDETPWCAAFVGSCLEEAGIVSSRSASALSYATFGVSCQAQVGAIAYKKRFNSAGKLIGGHVTFVVGQTSDGRLMCLGGNQGDKVGVVSYHPNDMVGYRWPHSVPPKRDALPILAGTTTSATEA